MTSRSGFFGEPRLGAEYDSCFTGANGMRVFALLALAVLGLTVTGCVPTAAVRRPEPTPTPYKPANLLTPRPTVPAAATATPPATTAAETTAATPAAEVEVGPDDATPTSRPVVLGGSPATVSEPLQGFLRDEKLTSPIIGDTFTYRVYLPPDYLRSPQRRYPVLYMLHGAGGDYTEWSDSYLPEQADRLIAAGEIPPMIIVMPSDGGQTYWANWAENGPRWGDYVADDVVGTADERYRTLKAAGSRAIGGLSMGGMGALNLALQHPDLFGVVGGHSPSIRLEPDPMLWFLPGQTFWDNNPIWLAQHQPGLDNLKVWLDAGTDDVWLPNIETVRDAFVIQGIQTEWHNYPGPHEAEYWIEHVPDYLQFYGQALQAESLDR